MNLTENFTLDEFIASNVAKERRIDNTPTPDIVSKLQFTAAGLERVRSLLGFPVKINSGYRCDSLNHAVGGAATSQHLKGEAVDFVCPLFGTPFQICTFLTGYMNIVGIDQMIMEGTWVHLSFTHAPRREILTYRAGKYLQGIV